MFDNDLSILSRSYNKSVKIGNDRCDQYRVVRGDHFGGFLADSLFLSEKEKYCSIDDPG